MRSTNWRTFMPRVEAMRIAVGALLSGSCLLAVVVGAGAETEFVNMLGYNFALESDGNQYNKYYVQSVTVRKGSE
jgi:hypothetical protein